MPTGISSRHPLDETGFGHRDCDLPKPAEGDAPDALRMDLRAWFPAAGVNEATPQGIEGAKSDTRDFEIELGSGKATFLAQQAPLEPHKLFLGIEWSSAYYRHSADRMRRLQLFNTQMLRADGPVFIDRFVADRTVSQFHWYFPDPWPKARHNKRRTFQESFLRDLHRVLIDPCDERNDTGRIRVVTDHLDYWEWMQVEAEKVADIYERETYVPPLSAREGEFVGSNFERKYIIEGRTINGMILRKKV